MQLQHGHWSCTLLRLKTHRWPCVDCVGSMHISSNAVSRGNGLIANRLQTQCLDSLKTACSPIHLSDVAPMEGVGSLKQFTE